MLFILTIYFIVRSNQSDIATRTNNINNNKPAIQNEIAGLLFGEFMYSQCLPNEIVLTLVVTLITL